MKTSRVRKKSRHAEHENHERWLVSYADFITLLFAFFVVMYATSTNNEEKQKKFEDSVRVNLHLGAQKDGKSQKDSDGTAGINLSELVPELNTPVSVFPKQGGPKEVEDYLDRSLDKKISKEVRQKMISSVRHDGFGARITLAASSFFPTGSAKLKYSSLQVLDQIADLIKETDRRIVIEGHTDNEPIIGGMFESNWELASLRATSVVRYLIKYQKVDPKRLAAISYADQKPIADNSTEEGRAQNRRIEILVATPDPEN